MPSNVLARSRTALGSPRVEANPADESPFAGSWLMVLYAVDGRRVERDRSCCVFTLRKSFLGDLGSMIERCRATKREVS